MAVPQEYEIIRDLDTVREAIIAENRGILLFFVNKYRQYLPREIYKTEHIPSSWVDQLSCCLVLLFHKTYLQISCLLKAQETGTACSTPHLFY